MQQFGLDLVELNQFCRITIRSQIYYMNVNFSYSGKNLLSFGKIEIASFNYNPFVPSCGRIKCCNIIAKCVAVIATSTISNFEDKKGTKMFKRVASE